MDQRTEEHQVSESSLVTSDHFSLNPCSSLFISRASDEPMVEMVGSPTSGRRRGKQKAKEPSLVLSLARSFGPTYFVAGLFKLAQDLISFASPQILGYDNCISHTH